jgi:hypothetical protein
LDKKAIIIQDKRELEDALRLFGKGLKGLEPIAWTASAVDGLRSIGLRYSLPEVYDRDFNRRDRWGDEVLAFKQWCDMLDKHVRDNVDKARILNLRPFLNKIHALRHVFDIYFHEIERLDNIARSQEHSEIYFFYYDKPQPSLLSRIADMTGPVINGKRLIHLSERRRKRYHSSLKLEVLVPDWFSVFPKTPGIRRLLHIAGSKKKKVLAFLVAKEHMEALDELAKLYNIEVIFWNDAYRMRPKPVDIPIEKIISRIKAERRLRCWTTRRGVDLFELFLPEIRKTLTEDIGLYVSGVERFLDIVKTEDITHVISTYEVPLFEAILDQCEMHNIPASVLLHGGTVGHLSNSPVIYFYTRGIGKDSEIYYLVYSKAICDYLEGLKTLYPAFTNTNLALGSSYFERLIQDDSRQSVNNPRKSVGAKSCFKICYICGPLNSSYSACDYRAGIYDEPSVYDLKQQVIERTKDNDGIELYFKYGYGIEHSGLDIIRKIDSGKWHNIHSISSRVSVEKAISDMDVVIIERPTTSLYEALATSKPLILFFDTRAMDLTAYARKLLEKRALIAESKQEFLSAVEELLCNTYNSRVFSFDNKDKSFILAFATCGDYKGTDRIVEFLGKMRENHARKEVDV